MYDVRYDKKMAATNKIQRDIASKGVQSL